MYLNHITVEYITFFATSSTDSRGVALIIATAIIIFNVNFTFYLFWRKEVVDKSAQTISTMLHPTRLTGDD